MNESATQLAPERNDVFTSLMAPAARLDPYAMYRHLASDGPTLDSGLGATFVFSHDLCLDLLRDKRTSVDERNSFLAGPGDDLPTLIHLDPPDHDRLRRLVQAAFTPRRVDGLRTRAQELVSEVVPALEGREDVDLIDAVAYPVPLLIICELLGIPEADHALVKDWSTVLARSIDPAVLRDEITNSAIAQAQSEFADYLRVLVQRRRRSPGDDLLSALSARGSETDTLSESELLGLALLLLVAGHETTVNLIGNSMLALLRHPDQYRLLHTGGVSARRAVDELLRFDSPVQMTTRIALEDIKLGAQTLAAGHFAVLMLGAANRDPIAMDRPDTLDLTATRQLSHLSFGSGLHHCLGAALARAEAEVVLASLATRYPHMELVAEAPIRPSFVLRGRTQLRVSMGRSA
jgi:cytochrome P450